MRTYGGSKKVRVRRPWTAMLGVPTLLTDMSVPAQKRWFRRIGAIRPGAGRRGSADFPEPWNLRAVVADIPWKSQHGIG